MTIESSLYERLEVPLNTLFPINQKYAFLVGAGISMAPPSNMPSAIQMVKLLLSFLVPEEEIKNILKMDTLRFELIVELIQNVIDLDLKFLDYLDSVKIPNLLHYFLSRLILKGNSVITTNFDYLLEYALKEIVPSNKHDKLQVIITKRDFIHASSNPESLQHSYNFVKIHGSKRNIFTNTITQDSVVATLSALGRDRTGEEVFAIEPYKKGVIYTLLKDHTLIVCGYSGNDDFDISPVLYELPFLSRIIWIEHTNGGELEIFRFLENSSEEENIKSHVVQFLSKLKNKHGYETILIRTNTQSLIRDHLWSIFHSEVSPESIITQSVIQTPLFSEFISTLYGSVSKLQKYHFATELYFKLKDIPSTIRCAGRGLLNANSVKATGAKSTFYNFLGLTHQIQGEYVKSLDFYSRSLMIDQKSGNITSQSSLLNNIGTIYAHLGNYEKSILNYELALRICEEIGDIRGKVTCLNNLGQIYENRNLNQKAKEYYISALELSEELDQKAMLHNNIGKILVSEDSNNAILHYKKALKIAELLGDLQGENILYNNIGRVLNEKGDFDSALTMFKKSITVAEKIGDISKKAGALSNVGSVYLAQKKWEQALVYFQEALHLEEKMGNPHLTGIYYNNAGMIYQQTGQIDKAIEMYKSSLQKFESIGAMSDVALILSKLADCYLIRKRYNESIEFFLHARKIYKTPELQDQKNLASVSSNLGRIYEILGNHEEALRYYEEAMKIDEFLGDQRNLAVDFFNIGKLQKTQEHLPIAIETLQKALDLFGQLGMQEQVNSIKQLLNTL